MQPNRLVNWFPFDLAADIRARMWADLVFGRRRVASGFLLPLVRDAEPTRAREKNGSKRVRTGRLTERMENSRVRLNQVMAGDWRIIDRRHPAIPVQLGRIPVQWANMGDIHRVAWIVRTIGTRHIS